MFHIDVTLEDLRVIAVEHRVALEGEDLKYAQDANKERTQEEQMALDKHDSTFDVTLVDGPTGRRANINLTTEELAEGLRVAIVGDDSPRAYENIHIVSLQKKLGTHLNIFSIIP